MKDGELKQRLKELTNEGYIEVEQLARIEREYFKEEAHDKRLMLSFALLGVLFVGLGLISICAFNWNYVPQIVRIGIAFVPLIGIQILLCWQYKRGASRIWIESLCLGLGLAFLLAIGLTYQVYQLSLGLEIIFLITFLVMLPVIYCCEAYYLAVLCLMGVVYYSLLEGTAFYNSLVILILPFYIKCLKYRGQKVMALTLGIILWSIEFLYFTLDYFDSNQIISYMLLFILFTRIKSQPLYKRIGYIAFYLWNFFIILVQPIDQWQHAMQFLPIIIFLIVLGYKAYISGDKEEHIEIEILLLQPILVGIWELIGDSIIMGILFNVYTVGCILYLLLIKGSQEKSFTKMRTGSLLVCIYALIKLFSLDVGLLMKGLGFIVAGLALLGANVWLNNQVRRTQSES